MDGKYDRVNNSFEILIFPRVSGFLHLRGVNYELFAFSWEITLLIFCIRLSAVAFHISDSRASTKENPVSWNSLILF